MIICLMAPQSSGDAWRDLYLRTEMVAAFLLGLTAQGIKIGVDTLVQARRR
jgi:hypothetical protein